MMLVGWSAAAAPQAPAAAPATASSASAPPRSSDGRTVELMSLGGVEGRTAARQDLPRDGRRDQSRHGVLGDDWPRDVVIVATASDDQFRALAGGGSDIAAATTAQRIVFAPGAADMSDESYELWCATSFFTMRPGR